MSGQEMSRQSSNYPGTAPDNRPFVLVVDDEPAVRSLVVRTLEANGFYSVSAADGLAARDLVVTGITPDLVLTDLKMPHMNGADLGQALGVLRPGLPVAYMSGFASECTDLLSPEILKHCFLAKPFSPAELVALVLRCIKSAKTHHPG